MDKNAKIYVSGHKGLVGSALVKASKSNGFTNLVLKKRSELDLLDPIAVKKFFLNEKPKYVLLAAAKVGGIVANNTKPAEFIYENLMIQNNVIHNAYLNKVKKLLFLGSSCIYPKLATQPIKESELLAGKLEETNEAYATAKIAGIKMCQAYNKQYGTNFISAMPTNLYGPNDNFNLNSSHVLPALIKKFHEAKVNNENKVICWGTGSPMREFLYVDDLAEACLSLMENYNESEVINVGTGIDITIKELAETIKAETGFTGEIEWDSTKPDGTPRKLLNVDKIHTLGWRHKTNLKTGIKNTYEWYKNNQKLKDL